MVCHDCETSPLYDLYEFAGLNGILRTRINGDGIVHIDPTNGPSLILIYSLDFTLFSSFLFPQWKKSCSQRCRRQRSVEAWHLVATESQSIKKWTTLTTVSRLCVPLASIFLPHTPTIGVMVWTCLWGSAIASIRDNDWQWTFPLTIYCIILYQRLMVCRDCNSIKIVCRDGGKGNTSYFVTWIVLDLCTWNWILSADTGIWMIYPPKW